MKKIFRFFILVFTVNVCNAESTYTISEVDYEVPKLNLIRNDGKMVNSYDEINDGRPVIVNFIYTSCSTICPMLTATLSALQKKLVMTGSNAHIISFSIDPEYDSPQRLNEYAEKFKANANWSFYSGILSDIQEIQKRFDAFRGDKMNHTSTIFVRNKTGNSWRRLDGFMAANDILKELNQDNVP